MSAGAALLAARAAIRVEIDDTIEQLADPDLDPDDIAGLCRDLAYLAAAADFVNAYDPPRKGRR